MSLHLPLPVVPKQSLSDTFGVHLIAAAVLAAAAQLVAVVPASQNAH